MPEPADPNNLSELIRRKRKEYRLTLSALSVLAGVSRSYINAVERGKRSAETESGCRVLIALGFDRDEANALTSKQVRRYNDLVINADYISSYPIIRDIFACIFEKCAKDFQGREDELLSRIEALK